MKKDIYHSIYNFCRVRNTGSLMKNGHKQTPRVKWILRYLKRHNIEFIVDKFVCERGVSAFNIILPSTKTEGVKVVTAHHDIVNPNVDNANDNSCSIINAIATKILSPETMVVLTDGEETGGIGAARLAKQIETGKWGQVDWILNFELTGKGGKSFFIGSQRKWSPLLGRVLGLFDCPVVNVPFNDSLIFRSYGIDSIVINPLPKEELDAKNLSRLFNCHTDRDTVETICPNDMKEFVEEVVLPIVNC